MAKKSAIPEDNREYPEYEYREYPKFVGTDAHGQALIAQKPEDVEALAAHKVYPKALGLNRDRKTVFANHPDEVSLRMGEVVHPLPEQEKDDASEDEAKARPASGDINPETGKPYTSAALAKAQAAYDRENPQS